MGYQRFKGFQFFRKINTEEKARNFVWKTRFGGKEFICRHCGHEEFYPTRTLPEVRKCKSCRGITRLRAGTIFQNSKVSMLTWLRAIHLVMQGKRGISALELQERLELGSYNTALGMVKKIRSSLMDRDSQYSLSGFIELDGTGFGKKVKGNHKEVMVAIETKEWIDKKGRVQARAGFAKVVVADENKENAEKFVSENIKPDTMINTDAGKAFVHLDNENLDYREMDSKQEKIDAWLPWVHRFISNAKAWIIGTHHGVRGKYLHLYLAEYTYRFNRRHDPGSLFHRALTACSQSDPKTLGMLAA